MFHLKHCRFEREDDFLVIFLTKQNVICSPGELELELLYLVKRYRPRHVSIDFSQVGYCSREAINDLLTTRRHILAGGAELQIRAMAPRVRTKFRSLRLDGHVFDIEGAAEPPVQLDQVSAEVN